MASDPENPQEYFASAFNGRDLETGSIFSNDSEEEEEEEKWRKMFKRRVTVRCCCLRSGGMPPGAAVTAALPCAICVPRPSQPCSRQK